MNTPGSGYVRPDHDPAGPRSGSKYGLIRVQLAGRIRIQLDPDFNAAGKNFNAAVSGFEYYFFRIRIQIFLDLEHI